MRQAMIALALVAAAPFAFAQKMYKCTDASGSTVFQQAPCAETAKEAEARSKERERLETEAKAKKDEEQRRKEAAIQKAKERDKAYVDQAAEREAERKKVEEAERRLMQGTTGGAGAAPAAPIGSPVAGDDGGLPAHVLQIYPGPWREGANKFIANAFAKKDVKNCSSYRYRQRDGGGDGEFIVLCTSPGSNGAHYFVWPKTEAVTGPVRF